MDTVPSFDLYRELEVDPRATTETIEAAWRSLVKRHHPDVASDGPAAREKIKRLNLAHEWLADRRLREMYDLTQGRRRPAPVPFDEPVRVVPVAPAEGRRYRASALISTAVVAVLAAAAFGSIAVNQTQEAGDDGARSGAAPASASASVLGAAVAPATSPAPTARVAGATSPPIGSTGLPDPAFDSDMPAGCLADGRVDRAGTIDGRDARLIFLRCGEARSFGPLLYAWSGSRWTKLEGGRFETAIPVDAGFGSITGEPNEYWVSWADSDGWTWVAVYRVKPEGPRAFWHSLDDGLAWQDANVRFIPNLGPRGKLQLEFTEGSDTCPSCPGQAYVEVYEWQGGTMERTYRNPANP